MSISEDSLRIVSDWREVSEGLRDAAEDLQDIWIFPLWRRR